MPVGERTAMVKAAQKPKRNEKFKASLAAIAETSQRSVSCQETNYEDFHGF
jgi:hypothetical protein